MTAPTPPGTPGAKKLKRPRRPAAHFLDLERIDHLSRAAWALGSEDHTAYQNALRWEFATFTSLRGAELEDLTFNDIHHDGTVTVRMGKGSKPRVAAFINGLDRSPTLARVRDWGLGKRKTDPVFTTSHRAWHHWVVHRLGPASGLQREIGCLNGSEKVTRYLIHPHLARANFVLIARRLPRTLGLEPMPWESICDLGGWESVDTIRRHYFYVDLDETLLNIRRAFPLGTFASAPAPDLAFKARWNRPATDKARGKSDPLAHLDGLGSFFRGPVGEEG